MAVQDLRDRLNELLSRDAAGVGGRLAGPLRPIDQGWAITMLYTATLAHGDSAEDAADTTVVIKLYAADAGGIAHATRESAALNQLGAVGYPVPAVIYFEADPGLVGRPVLIMEHIAGCSFWTDFETADSDARARLLTLFTERLVLLHAVDPRVLGADADQSDPYGAIDSELVGLRRDADTPELATLSTTLQWLEKRRDTVRSHRAVILHRDYHPWNVVVDATGCLWVLDWDWTIGDPRFDLAWTCTLMQRSGHRAFSDQVRAEYERQVGRELAEFDYFEVLATTRWLMNVLPALGPRSQLPPAKRDAFRTFLTEPLARAQELLRRHTGLDVTLTPDGPRPENG